MRRIVLDLAVTLDGFIEGTKGETDWCIIEDDMNFDEFLSGIDAIFYGRVSYETWGNYQPADNTTDAEKKLWESVHTKKKYVFSGTKRKDDKAIFINNDIVRKVRAIKQEEGKDIWLYGGANLVKTFIHLGLVDLFRISLHPVALGGGKPLFADLKERLALKLITTKTFRSGVVQLIYEPVK